ncbi:MAG: transcriptional regulator, ArsR family [Bacteroidetes bacterium]|nr:transcriptional regulator, ArsR family [Bacteroidota bacterium]
MRASKKDIAIETFSVYIRLSKYSFGESVMKELEIAFKALADESRLRILNLLFASGELCVCDVEAITGFTQTKVSRHLLYLKNAGLLDSRQHGLWMLYKIATPKNDEHRQLLDCLEQILQSNTVAQRDTKELAKNIKKGCCTTFSTIKPNQIPANLELN